MRREKTFAAEGSWPMVLKGLGLSKADVLRRAQLPVNLFERDQARLTTAQFFALWASVEAGAGHTAFPLLIADQITGDVFAPCQFSALCSPNMRVALDRLTTYKRLTAPMSLEVIEDGPHTRVRVCWLDAQAPPPASLVAFELAYLLRVIRIGTREPIAPVDLVSQQPMAPAETFAAWMGVVPRVGVHDEVAFLSTDLERPFLTENIGFWGFFEGQLKAHLAELDRESSITDQVRAVLLQALPGGCGTLAEVARELGMSPRTLQRRLTREGQVFKDILQDTRSRLARHYLIKTDITATEIGFLLGFDDASSFFRAYQAWTGSTPEATRRAARPASVGGAPLSR